MEGGHAGVIVPKEFKYLKGDGAGSRTTMGGRWEDIGLRMVRVVRTGRLRIGGGSADQREDRGEDRVLQEDRGVDRPQNVKYKIRDFVSYPCPGGGVILRSSCGRPHVSLSNLGGGGVADGPHTEDGPRRI